MKEPMDLYPEIKGEVTQEELLNTFIIFKSDKEITGWRKRVGLREPDGYEYFGTLSWDADDGYLMYWDSEYSPEEAERPEFEYSLDCITEDMEYDRNNPWDMLLPEMEEEA